MANERLVNSVSVGVVYVGDAGDFAISNDEKIHIMAKVQDGLADMAANEPRAQISWATSSLTANITGVTPWEGARWPGLPEDYYRGFDAALWSDTNKRIYFFKGNKYVRVNPDDGWKMEAGYPKPIAGNWPGLPASFTSGIDSAIWAESLQKIYFFKGDQYVRVDPNNGWQMDAGYPKPIAGNWPNMPADFATGIDASFWSHQNDRIYMFKGDQYIRINPSDGWKTEAGYPKPIAGNWPGMDDNFSKGIDAALMAKKNNRIYMFKKARIVGQYVRINPSVSWNVEDGYPKPIGLGWEEAESQWRDKALQQLGFPAGNAGIEQLTAFFQNGAGAQFGYIVFFTKFPTVWFAYAGGLRVVMRQASGSFLDWASIGNILAHETGHIFAAPDEYASSNCVCDSIHGRFFKAPNGNCANCADPSVNCLMKNNTVSELCEYTPLHYGWEAFLDKIDASLHSFKNNKIYLFNSKYYIRYTATDFVFDDGYPKGIKTNWPNLVDSFTEGIDASLWSDTNKRVYMFKGDQYVRINPDDGWNMEAGYPKPIAGNWPGLPSSFTSGIDAALWSPPNGRIYLFKGSQYVRINPSVGWGVEAGYPKPITGNWPGLPADFTSGIDSALWGESNQRVYLFKGTRYVRLNPASGWAMEAGYPKQINKNWKMPFPEA